MSDPPESGETPEWYANGLRFECTQCGNCCTGPPGYVWFNDDEAKAMARVRRITVARFYRDYAAKHQGGWSLREQETKHGFDCVFLDRETVPGRAICGVYDARPAQCRTWPFWPENLSSEKVWHRVKKTTPCPGMDRGTLVPVESIRIQRDTVIT